MSWLIVVTGHPGSGKSTLADRLSRDLNIPVWHRDDFKEILFDTLGSPSVADSGRLGGSSWALIHYAAKTLMCCRLPVILEANYSPVPGRDEIRSLLDTYAYQALELIVEAPAAVLATRFQRRIADGTRHPGHHDDERLMEMTLRVMEPYEPLAVTDHLRHVDTSLPDAAVYPALLRWIREHLERPSQPPRHEDARLR